MVFPQSLGQWCRFATADSVDVDGYGVGSASLITDVGLGLMEVSLCVDFPSRHRVTGGMQQGGVSQRECK